MAKRFSSTFDRWLGHTRFVLSPREMIGPITAIRGVDPAALGIFIRMLPYAATGTIQKDFVMIGRFANVHHSTVRKHWDDLATFFDVFDNGTMLVKEMTWLSVEGTPTERRGLRRLLGKLIGFWGPQCVYCKAPGELHIDHIVPVARGGSNEIQNLTLACPTCNMRKHTSTAEEFGFPEIHSRAAEIR